MDCDNHKSVDGPASPLRGHVELHVQSNRMGTIVVLGFVLALLYRIEPIWADAVYLDAEHVLDVVDGLHGQKVRVLFENLRHQVRSDILALSFESITSHLRIEEFVRFKPATVQNQRLS